MYFIVKFNVETFDIDFIESDKDLNIDVNELIGNIGPYLNNKYIIGTDKGGFLINFENKEFISVFRIENIYCTVLAMKRDINFEDPNKYLIDSLTGLETEDVLLNTINDKLLNNKKFHVLVFNIDDFRTINDIYGFEKGNLLLKCFTERILINLVSNYKLYRLEGDSFVFLHEGRNIDSFITSFYNLLEKPFVIENNTFYINISLGYVVVDRFINITPENILDKSLVALNHAKSLGKNTYVKYSDDLKAVNSRELELESMIKEALIEGQFSLNYQPIVDVKNGFSIVSSEALIRWENPEEGFISPELFISVAEKSGLVIKIGEWVIDEVCKQQRKWMDSGINVKTVYLNIGAVHFKKDFFVDDLFNLLDKYSLPPQLIGLEITERVMVGDNNKIIDKINKLRDKGIKISIDDFGTGYSSLSYLSNFKIDSLKVDKSFVEQINFNTNVHSVVKAIINLSRDLGINVIGEGVESDGSYDILTSLGCYLIQGYKFYKPMSAEDFKHVLISNI